VKPSTVILHSRADDVIPFAESEQLARNSGATLIEIGSDHRLADPESLAAMLVHVEELVEAERTDSRPARATLAWAEKQGEGLQRRLEKAGLIELRDGAKKECVTLGPFIDAYVTSRSDVKGSTALVYGHTVRNLKEYFGGDKPLKKITPGDADEFKLWLRADKRTCVEADGRKLKGQDLADSTANRRCTLAGQLFRAAKRK